MWPFNSKKMKYCKECGTYFHEGFGYKDYCEKHKDKIRKIESAIMWVTTSEVLRDLVISEAEKTIKAKLGASTWIGS